MVKSLISAQSPSVVRAFVALWLFALRQNLRVRMVAIVAFCLLGLTAAVVAAVTYGPQGWRLENRIRRVMDPKDKDNEKPLAMTYQQYCKERLPLLEYGLPSGPDAFGIKVAVFESFKLLVNEQMVLDDFALQNFDRWVVLSLYLGFLLPLFALAYASNALGGEREERTMLWLLTRPLPRWAIYLAKWLGVMPWCVGVTLLGFGLVCLAGGDLGRKSFAIFWPAVAGGSFAFGCVFHLFGAVFRRPTILGLVYVFFYETLFGNLPGGLKQFSLGYYVRSLFYNDLGSALKLLKPEGIDVYAPTDSASAWIALAVISIAVTALGAWLFGRLEPKDET